MFSAFVRASTGVFLFTLKFYLDDYFKIFFFVSFYSLTSLYLLESNTKKEDISVHVEI